MSILGFSLEGKVAIVTGGKRGLGKDIALALAEAGADVIICTRVFKDATDNLEVVAQEIRKLGRRSLAVQADVSRKADVDALVQKTMDEFGVVDILVNNAGGSARERASLFCESTEEVWDYVLGINLKSTLLCTRAVINQMIERRYGKIVNIASTSGVVGDAARVDYSAAKAAIIGFTMALAKEVAPHDINVNCVSPGPTATPGLLSQPPERVEQVKQMTGLGRLGTSEGVASLVAWLASDKANSVTGQNYVVCGLRTLGP